LSQLPQLRYPDHGALKTAVFLATPPLAHLLDETAFLKSAMTRIYGHWPNVDHVTSIGAVVDALPGLNKVNAGQDDAPGTDSLSRPSEQKKRRILVDAEDGLAFLLTPTPVDQQTAQYALPAQGDGLTIIRFGSQIGPFWNPSETTWGRVHVTLPVANTLFVNGRPATLFADNWAKTATDSSQPLRHMKRSPLRTYTVQVPRLPHAAFQGHIPLTPLTKPRTVVNVMGNVLREIEKDGHCVPASAELETAVAEFMSNSKRSAASGHFQVYALVKTQPERDRPEPETPARHGAGDAATGEIDGGGHLPIAGQIFRHKARLFRVTGGGGGWGNRQGLLTLDPAVDFEAPNDAALLPDSELDDPFKESLQAAKLIPAGSTVQFFAFSSHEGDKSRKAVRNMHDVSKWSPDDWLSSGNQHFILGTIPRQDLLHGHGGIAAENWPPLLCLPRRFGMLSEGGSALGTDETYSRKSRDGLYPQDFLVGARSRVDVPFSFFESHLRVRTKEKTAVKAATIQGKNGLRQQAQKETLSELGGTVPRAGKPGRPRPVGSITFDVPVPEQGAINTQNLQPGEGTDEQAKHRQETTTPGQSDRIDNDDQEGKASKKDTFKAKASHSAAKLPIRKVKVLRVQKHLSRPSE